MSREQTCIDNASPLGVARLGDLLRDALGLTSVASPGHDVEISDICIDSRLVRPGSLFVAMPGTKAHGITFARQALDRGAVAIVTDVANAPEQDGLFIRVPDARVAAARLAASLFGLREIQSRGGLTMVGVTGTNGKSTSTYMMREMIRAAGHSAALLGTIEYDLVTRKLASDLTTPDAVTLARHLVEAHHAGARYGVMEVSSHSLDQRRTDGIEFAVAIFTNLTRDHLDYHATFDDYLLAKRRLFDGLKASTTAIVNAHDPASQPMTEHCRAKIVRFGFDDNADVRGRILDEDANGTRFVLTGNDNSIEVRLPLVGRHNVMNALCSAAAGLALGFDLPTVARGLKNLPQVPGRLQKVTTPASNFAVFVDYAHTDDALRNVLTAIRPLTHGRLWCVFGCGGDRDKLKRPLMAKTVAALADAFIITSDNPRTEDPLAIIEQIKAGLTPVELARGSVQPDRASAIDIAVSRLGAGDALIIAGKGHENYQIVGTTRHHFDDVEVATAAIEQRRKKGG
jgi:UDP-N-acetylmuramoyl-L-alanyl-D-glutamate--2,6-diaminopimelate ligase